MFVLTQEALMKMNMEFEDRVADRAIAATLVALITIRLFGVEWAFPMFAITFAVAICFAIATLVSVAIHGIHGEGWGAGLAYLKSERWRAANVGIGIVGIVVNDWLG